VAVALAPALAVVAAVDTPFAVAAAFLEDIVVVAASASSGVVNRHHTSDSFSLPPLSFQDLFLLVLHYWLG